jgi:hypothetical protein
MTSAAARSNGDAARFGAGFKAAGRREGPVEFLWKSYSGIDNVGKLNSME